MDAATGRFWACVNLMSLTGRRCRAPSTPAPARCGPRTRDVADLVESNRSTITRWLDAGMQRERDDGDVGLRLDTLDRAISDRDTDSAPMRYVAP